MILDDDPNEVLWTRAEMLKSARETLLATGRRGTSSWHLLAGRIRELAEVLRLLGELEEGEVLINGMEGDAVTPDEPWGRLALLRGERDALAAAGQRGTRGDHVLVGRIREVAETLRRLGEMGDGETVARALARRRAGR